MRIQDPRLRVLARGGLVAWIAAASLAATTSISALRRPNRASLLCRRSISAEVEFLGVFGALCKISSPLPAFRRRFLLMCSDPIQSRLVLFPSSLCREPLKAFGQGEHGDTARPNGILVQA